jgi:hypothetical protein
MPAFCLRSVRRHGVSEGFACHCAGALYSGILHDTTTTSTTTAITAYGVSQMKFIMPLLPLLLLQSQRRMDFTRSGIMEEWD